MKANSARRGAEATHEPVALVCVEVLAVSGVSPFLVKGATCVCCIKLGAQRLFTGDRRFREPKGLPLLWADFNEAHYFDMWEPRPALVIQLCKRPQDGLSPVVLADVVIGLNTLKHAVAVKAKVPLQCVSTTTQPGSYGTVSLRVSMRLRKVPISMADFEPLNVLGHGNFGRVMQVRQRDSNKILAMKIVPMESVIRSNAVHHTLSEINVLQRIDHPFIVGLKYAFHTPEALFMVMDFVAGGELFFHLSNVDRFTERRTAFYAAELVLALEYLHSMNVVYRDMKPENVLLDLSGHLRLTDFGLVKEDLRPGRRTRTFCGSPEYLAPEVLLGQSYGRAVDWWALGTLVYEMLSGNPPFYDQDVALMHESIVSAPLPSGQPGLFSRNAWSLCEALLSKDPARRLGTKGVEEVKAHPFFGHIDWELLLLKKVDVPFKPRSRHVSDVTYFEPRFTTQTLDWLPSSPELTEEIASPEFQALWSNFDHIARARAFEDWANLAQSSSVPLAEQQQEQQQLQEQRARDPGHRPPVTEQEAGPEEGRPLFQSAAYPPAEWMVPPPPDYQSTSFVSKVALKCLRECADGGRR